MQTKTLNLSIVFIIIAFIIGLSQTPIAATPANILLDFNKTGVNLFPKKKIGKFKVTPQDSFDYQFKLVSGTGSQHNQLFDIQGNWILTDDFIKNPGTKSIRVQACSPKDTLVQQLTIEVIESFYTKSPMSNIPGLGGLTSTISISEKVGLKSLRLFLRLEHTKINSIRATLTHKKSNTSVDLVKSLKNSNCNNESMLLTFSMDAPSLIDSSNCEIYDTTYQPVESFYNFKGYKMSGDWELSINIPSLSSDSGMLQQWAINFIPFSSSNANNIELSDNSINRDASKGTDIGHLSTNSAIIDTTNTINFQLVSGKGDAQNHLFQIENDKLKVDSNLTSGHQFVRIEADDGNNTIEEVKIITVEDTNTDNNNTYVDTFRLSTFNRSYTLIKKIDTSREDPNIDSIHSQSSQKKQETTSSAIEEDIENQTDALFYPNPFSNNTTLQYELNHMANVTLRIFNMNGKLIKKVIKKEQESGLHQIMWNVNELKSQNIQKGTYIYSLKIKNTNGQLQKKESGKIVRLK